jgi:hypothetical protein
VSEEFIRAFFFAHYWAWALIWGHVLVYFGRFAHHSWRDAGGKWGHVPRETWDLFKFIFIPLIADVKAVLTGRKLPELPPGNYRYDRSHRLSLNIAIAATAYVFIGSAFATLDRSNMSSFMLCLNAFFILITCVAGLGHLLTPLEHNTRRWRWFVVSILAWYPISMLLFYLYMSMVGTPSPVIHYR